MMKYFHLTVLLIALNNLGLCQEEEVQVIHLDDITQLIELTRNLTVDMQGLHTKVAANQEMMMQEIANIKEDLEAQANSKHDILLQRIQATEEVLIEKITTVEGHMRKIKDQMIILNTDGVIKEVTEGDVDGCTSECPENAHCFNVDGKYKCTCLPGYHGDGVSCEALDCASPSKVIQGLGCVVPMNDDKFPFDLASLHCRNQGLRLLQGIDSAEQVGEIQRSFADMFSWDYWMMSAWIGLKNRTWIDGFHGPINFDSGPWSAYDMNTASPDDIQCGNICVPTETKEVSLGNCSSLMYALCQKWEY